MRLAIWLIMITLARHFDLLAEYTEGQQAFTAIIVLMALIGCIGQDIKELIRK